MAKSNLVLLQNSRFNQAIHITVEFYYRPNVEKPADKFVGEDGVIDYAKMMEKPSVRRKRFLSLGVVSYTAFIFNLSFSIILTSAKPYLDKVFIFIFI